MYISEKILITFARKKSWKIIYAEHSEAGLFFIKIGKFNKIHKGPKIHCRTL